MTLAPRDYITERRREITQRIDALKSELAVLDKMESALADGPLMVVGPPPAYSSEAFPARRRRISGGIKGIVLEILQKNPDGLTAQQILNVMNLHFDTKLPRTSLSPQLSRLKKDELVRADNAVWSITEKGMVQRL